MSKLPNSSILLKLNKLKKNVGTLDANIVNEVIDYVKELEAALLIASQVERKDGS